MRGQAWRPSSSSSPGERRRPSPAAAFFSTLVTRRIPGITVETYAVPTPALKARDWWRNPGAARLMVLEYCKYLAILGREGVLGLGPREAPAANPKPAQGNPTT